MFQSIYLLFSVLFSKVLNPLVMIHSMATAISASVGQITAGQVAHFLEVLWVFLPLASVSPLLTKVRRAMMNERKLQHAFLKIKQVQMWLSLCARLWFVWLHQRHGSHGSHDNHGQSWKWRLHLFLFHLLRGRRRRRHGKLPFCVHFH